MQGYLSTVNIESGPLEMWPGKRRVKSEASSSALGELRGECLGHPLAGPGQGLTGWRELYLANDDL